MLCILGSELDGSYVQVDQNLQPMASAIPPKGDGCITQPPQFELVAHSMVSMFDSMGFEKFDLLVGLSHFFSFLILMLFCNWHAGMCSKSVC